MDNSICKSCSNDGAGCPYLVAIGEISKAEDEGIIITDDITGCIVDCNSYQRKEC